MIIAFFYIHFPRK